MTNQNDNKIEALMNEAETLNTLMREFQNTLKFFSTGDSIEEQDLLEQQLDDEANERALAEQVEIETQQREIIDEIATLEAGVEEQDVLMNALRKKRKALQKKVTKAQTAKYKLQSRLKTQRKRLEKLGGEINTTEIHDEVITVLPEHTDERARMPEYHVSPPSTDLGNDWVDKWRDKRGNRRNA